MLSARGTKDYYRLLIGPLLETLNQTKTIVVSDIHNT